VPFARVIVDREVFEDMCGSECDSCGSNDIEKKWNTYGKGPSPDLEKLCKDCAHKSSFKTSSRWSGDKRRALSYIILMLAILFSGSTWTKVAALFGILEINVGSKSQFIGNFQDRMEIVVDEVTKEFLRECRKKTKSEKEVFVIIDAGWSHPGWWARECTVTAIDGYTYLPIAIFHVRKGEKGNYIGSSKGMEGFGVLEVMKELKKAGFTVTKLLHDKDSSAMKQVMEVFQDVQEALCLSKT
jgi:hypothetical protein